jgi:hypothetical protein
MKKLAGILALVLVASLAGCKKDKDNGAGGAGKPTEGGGAALPALTAEPPMENITPAEKSPFEAVTFRMTAKRNKGGWPEFTAYNLGTKPITFMAITGYAYDKDGKQVARTDVPLSWNGNLKPGAASDWPVSVGSFSEGQITAAATSFQLCYDSLKFEGDTDFTSDDKLCPEQRPKK